jgi:hypothetical protein
MARQALTVSAAQARQLAVAAQLAGQAARTPHDVLVRLGAIQLDAMQRVDKSHRLVCYARLAGPQGSAAVDEFFWSAQGDAAAFEMPAHAVCLLPAKDWPLWGFRRAEIRQVSWAPPAAACDRLIVMVRESGPQTLRDLEAGQARSLGWEWSHTKRVAEYLVWTGGLVCCARLAGRRVYDLPERRLPERLLGQEASRDEAIAALVLKAARACGIATVGDLASYFQLPKPEVAAAVTGCGLVRAEAEGWDEVAWAHPAVLGQAGLPASPVFVSPFDSLVWDRARIRRIFGFDYALEAYKPAARRVYGHYVMPLVVRDEIGGRADIARERGALRVTFFAEPGFDDQEAVDVAAGRLASQIGCQLAEPPACERS